MSEIIITVLVAVVFFCLGLFFNNLVKSRQQKKEQQMEFIFETLQYIECAKELRKNHIDETLSMLETNIYRHLLYFDFIEETAGNKNKEKSRLNFEKASKHTIFVWQEAKDYFMTYGIDTLKEDAMMGLIPVDFFELFQQTLKEVPPGFNEKYTGENALSAPALEVAAWLDGPTSLEQLRGKIVLLSFWDVECERCTFMLPELQKMKEKYGDKGLEIISIHTPCKDDASVIKFFAKHSYTFRKAIASFETSKAYYLHNTQIPMFFLVNKSGNIVESLRHQLPATSVIEELLAI